MISSEVQGYTRYLVEVPGEDEDLDWNDQIPGDGIVARAYFSGLADTENDTNAQPMMVELHPGLSPEEKQLIVQKIAKDVVVVNPIEMNAAPLEFSYVQAMLHIAQELTVPEMGVYD